MVRGSNPACLAGTSTSLTGLANTLDDVRRRNENAASERTVCLRELFSISVMIFLQFCSGFKRIARNFDPRQLMSF